MKKIALILILSFSFLSCVKEASKKSLEISVNGKWKLTNSYAIAYAPMNAKGPVYYNYNGPSGGGFFTIEKDSIWTVSDYNPVDFSVAYDQSYNNVSSLSITPQIGARPTQSVVQLRISDTVFIGANSRKDSIFIKSITDSSMVLYERSYKNGKPGIVTYSFLTFTKQ